MVWERLKSVVCFLGHANDHGLLGFRRRYFAWTRAAHNWNASASGERHDEMKKCQPTGIYLMLGQLEVLSS